MTRLSRTMVRKFPTLSAVNWPSMSPPASDISKATWEIEKLSVSAVASRRSAPVSTVSNVGGGAPAVASASQGDGCPLFRVVRTHMPSGSGRLPVSTNSNRAVWRTTLIAASGSFIPGNSTRMRRLPSTCTSGSLTPSPFTRWSMICRAVARSPASTESSTGTSTSSKTCKPPRRSSPGRMG